MNKSRGKPFATLKRLSPRVTDITVDKRGPVSIDNCRSLQEADGGQRDVVGGAPYRTLHRPRSSPLPLDFGYSGLVSRECRTVLMPADVATNCYIQSTTPTACPTTACNSSKKTTACDTPNKNKIRIFRNCTGIFNLLYFHFFFMNTLFPFFWVKEMVKTNISYEYCNVNISKYSKTIKFSKNNKV